MSLLSTVAAVTSLLNMVNIGYHDVNVVTVESGEFSVNAPNVCNVMWYCHILKPAVFIRPLFGVHYPAVAGFQYVRWFLIVIEMRNHLDYCLTK